MVKKNEVLKEIGNLSTKIGVMDTKIEAIDDKVGVCNKGIDSLVKTSKEQLALINNNKNRIVKLETKSEGEEKKISRGFFIWGAIIGGIFTMIGSLITKFVK